MEEKEMGNQEVPIEESLKELDGIVEKLESRDISLEESFAMYQKGMELLKQCSSKIDRVEKKMLKINEDGELSEFYRRIGREDPECGRYYKKISS